MPPNQRRTVEVLLTRRPELTGGKLPCRQTTHDTSDEHACRVSLPSLSDDVMVLVMHHGLDVLDLIALRKMNRRLHGFTKLRSVWFYIIDASKHRFSFAVKFPLSNSLSASQLERLATGAFALQRRFVSPDPLPLKTTCVTGSKSKTFYSSFKVVDGIWLLTLQAEGFARITFDPMKYVLRLWKIKGSAAPEPQAQLDLSMLGCVSILDAQILRCGDIAVALKGLSYQIKIAICKLPSESDHAAFRPSLLGGCMPPVLWSATVTSEDTALSHQCPMAFCMDQELYAHKFNSTEFAVVNWKQGVHVLVHRHNIIGIHETYVEVGAIVQLEIIGRYLLCINAWGEELYLLPPELLAERPAAERGSGGTLRLLDPKVERLAQRVRPASEDGTLETISAQLRTMIVRNNDGKEDAIVSMMLFEATPVAEHDKQRERQQYVDQYELHIPYHPMGPPTDDERSSFLWLKHISSTHLEERLPVEFQLQVEPFAGPPQFTVSLADGGRRAMWFCGKRSAWSPEDRLRIYVAPRSVVKGTELGYDVPPVPTDCLAPNEAIVRALFSDAYAANLKLRERQKFHNATCCTFDDVRGRLFVGTGGGELFILSYAGDWADEEYK